MNRCPPLVKDIYYDSENMNLPYTEAAAAYKKKTYRGSVANMTLVSCVVHRNIRFLSQDGSVLFRANLIAKLFRKVSRNLKLLGETQFRNI